MRRNQMESNSNVANKKQETMHIIAILDLLGTSESIKDNSSENVMNTISYIFDKAYYTWPYLESAPDVLQRIKRVIFSDNIALALELSESMSDDEKRSAVNDFIVYINVFQGMALKSGLFFRGGISIGQLYMDSDKNFIWGKALIDAHTLEEKVAIYPRVVLSHQFEQIELHDTTVIAKDFDGISFVDYLSIVKMEFPEWIDETKERIQDAYVKYAGKERILQKYGWLQHYIEENE